MTELHSAIFAWFFSNFGPPSRVLVAYQLQRGEILLHNAVVVNCKKAQVYLVYGLGVDVG